MSQDQVFSTSEWLFVTSLLRTGHSCLVLTEGLEKRLDCFLQVYEVYFQDKERNVQVPVGWTKSYISPLDSSLYSYQSIVWCGRFVSWTIKSTWFASIDKNESLCNSSVLKNIPLKVLLFSSLIGFILRTTRRQMSVQQQNSGTRGLNGIAELLMARATHHPRLSATQSISFRLPGFLTLRNH